MIPPNANADFVCAMEDVLGVYVRPYDPKRPVVCFDEMSKQLVKETREPIPAEIGRKERFDYEYERNGTANIFINSEPLAGRRSVKVTDRRTAIDFAEVIREIVEDQYPDAKKSCPCHGQPEHPQASIICIRRSNRRKPDGYWTVLRSITHRNTAVG